MWKEVSTWEDLEYKGQSRIEYAALAAVPPPWICDGCSGLKTAVFSVVSGEILPTGIQKVPDFPIIQCGHYRHFK